jgi:hypothetical protein
LPYLPFREGRRSERLKFSMNVSTAAKKAARTEIPDTWILPDSDAWQTGNVVQVKLGGE